MMVKHLVDLGLVSDVFTETIDGLLVKAGIPGKQVHEIFGSKFSLSCEKCQKIHYRSKQITKSEGHCQKMVSTKEDGVKSLTQCGGKLLKTYSEFSSFIVEKQNSALFAALQSKLIIVLGSTLKKDPCATIPMATQMSSAGGAICVINESTTQFDLLSKVRVFGNSKMVLEQLFKKLNLVPPPYKEKVNVKL